MPNFVRVKQCQFLNLWFTISLPLIDMVYATHNRRFTFLPRRGPAGGLLFQLHRLLYRSIRIGTLALVLHLRLLDLALEFR
jgi:hypothetical protein